MIHIDFGSEVVEKIKNGGIGIIPTDTLYGIVCSALNRDAVEKLREVRSREDKKPLVVIISDISDLKLFKINLDQHEKELCSKFWPGQVSIVLPGSDENFSYLTRGTGTIAFRVPASVVLRELLSKTGPLVAPSANLPGQKPAQTIVEAKSYFPSLDFYIDVGELEGEPSTLIGFENGKVKVYRQGAFTIPQELLSE